MNRFWISFTLVVVCVACDSQVIPEEEVQPDGTLWLLIWNRTHPALSGGGGGDDEEPIIIGEVNNASGQSVSGATVESVSGTTGQVLALSQTNSSGQFSMTTAPGDQYFRVTTAGSPTQVSDTVGIHSDVVVQLTME